MHSLAHTHTHTVFKTLECLFHFTRSRDVAELHANLTFDPVKINVQQAQYQCEHAGRKSVCVQTDVCFTYSIKSDQQDLNFVAGEPYSSPCWFIHSFIQICCVLLLHASVSVVSVLQGSATVWHWMLCVQKPGPHLLTRMIKVIVRLPGTSPSKTERHDVCKKPSWCRQVLRSLWRAHGVTYGFPTCKEIHPETTRLAPNPQDTEQTLDQLDAFSFCDIHSWKLHSWLGICKLCFKPERIQDKAVRRHMQSRKTLVLTWNRPVLIKACLVQPRAARSDKSSAGTWRENEKKNRENKNKWIGCYENVTWPFQVFYKWLSSQFKPLYGIIKPPTVNLIGLLQCPI